MSSTNVISPILSVVIPTKNRFRYAISSITSILNISSDKLELIVQDNSDNLDLESWLQSNVSDLRLRYNFTKRPLSFIGNFCRAAELATGEYMCFIGDDDTVNPEIIEAACWAESQNLDVLIPSHAADYLWPGTGVSSTIFTKGAGGSLSIKEFTGIIEEVDMEEEILKLVRNGGLYYLNYKLPKLYHGLVRRSCLESIHEKTGSYFGGLSPDTYASLAIACVARRVAAVDYPLTIPGACKVSGSVVEGNIKRHSKSLEDAPHLRHRGEYHWSDIVPRIYCVETIWVDSSIAALRAMGRDDFIEEINLPKLAAFCVGANRDITKSVLRGLLVGLRIMDKNTSIGIIQFLWNLIFGPGVKFIRRAWNRFLIILGIRDLYVIDKLNNIADASDALVSYLKINKKSFSCCVHLQ
jgi:glycosyltransferase involved in cell wall biosynthesis